MRTPAPPEGGAGTPRPSVPPQRASRTDQGSFRSDKLHFMWLLRLSSAPMVPSTPAQALPKLPLPSTRVLWPASHCVNTGAAGHQLLAASSPLRYLEQYHPCHQLCACITLTPQFLPAAQSGRRRPPLSAHSPLPAAAQRECCTPNPQGTAASAPGWAAWPPAGSGVAAVGAKSLRFPSKHIPEFTQEAADQQSNVTPTVAGAPPPLLTPPSSSHSLIPPTSPLHPTFSSVENLSSTKW